MSSLILLKSVQFKSLHAPELLMQERFSCAGGHPIRVHNRRASARPAPASLIPSVMVADLSRAGALITLTLDRRWRLVRARAPDTTAILLR
jgi:hypothetical protein